MDITLRQLEVFVAIARSRHLRQAAAHLGMTSSAASMALSALERSAGGPLFTRAGRGLLLNDRGRRLLSGAEGLVQGAAEWLASARGRDGALQGNLRIGCSMTVGNYCLPVLLPAFHQAHPQTSVSLLVSNSAEVCEQLRQAHIDLAVIESEELPPDLSCTPWLRDEMILIAAPTHGLTQKAVVKTKDLAGQAWIIRERGSGSMEIARQLLSKIPGSHAITEMGSSEAIKRAVAGGLGLALISSRCVQRELAEGALRKLPLARPIFRRFHVLTMPGQHASSLASAFRLWLQSQKD